MSDALIMSDRGKVVDVAKMAGGLAITFGDDSLAILRHEWVRSCAVQHEAFVDSKALYEETGDDNQILAVDPD